MTTDSRKTKASPNLIRRVFTTDGPNACWFSDITYIPTREGWLYLAAVSGCVLAGRGGLGHEPNPGLQAGQGCPEHGDRSPWATGDPAL